MDQSVPIVTTQEVVESTDAAVQVVVNSGVDLAQEGVTTVEKAPEPREIAYVITDSLFGHFDVIKSANAWWMDSEKVSKLIEAFKAGHTIKAALVWAKIKQGQWEYFNKMHPDFSEVKAACEENQMFRAMNTVNGDMQSPQTARWFVGKRHPAFQEVDKENEDGILKPQVPSAPMIQASGNVQINIDAREIASAIRAVAEEVLGADADSAAAIADQAVAAVPAEAS